MLELTPERERLLGTDGHILVLGGPGCGKTTIALLKAANEIQANSLLAGQRVLFLSFARATIARVAEQAGSLISPQNRAALEINTYHGFAWNLIRSHDYLLNPMTPIRLLPPPEAASKLAELPKEARPGEIKRLFEQEGLLHFDLFASVSAEILTRSRSILRILCDSYPTIILDEFQDTNAEEWLLLRQLASGSRLIALADAEQRIYEFRGADPKRIGEFIECCTPTQFDFGTENRRSDGTDIVTFGNDLLTGANRGKVYVNVEIKPYGFYKGWSAHFWVKTVIIEAVRRLLRTGDGSWSLAVLVPSKRLMLQLSDCMSAKADGLPSLPHDVAIDAEGPALAAAVIAGLLEGAETKTEMAHRVINDVCSHMRGRRGGNSPPQGELALVGSLEGYMGTGKIRGKNRERVVNESIRIAEFRQDLALTGDPLQDWLAVRTLFGDSLAPPLQKVAEDAFYLRLLRKGTPLRSRLGEIWRTTGSYAGAGAVVKDALLQEHFSASTKVWHGVHVMTMHKAKGKEFSEVVVYEGYHQGRIVRDGATDRDVAQARLALRVAVTRAMQRATIVTPKSKVCEFLQ